MRRAGYQRPAALSAVRLFQSVSASGEATSLHDYPISTSHKTHSSDSAGTHSHAARGVAYSGALHDGAMLVRMAERHLVTVHVPGRPSSYSTAHEKPWKDSVRKAIAATGVQPQDARSPYAWSSESPPHKTSTRNGTWTTSSNQHLTRWKASSASGHGRDIHSQRTTGSTAWRLSNIYHGNANP